MSQDTSKTSDLEEDKNSTLQTATGDKQDDDEPLVSFRKVGGPKKNVKKRTHDASTSGGDAGEDGVTITKKVKTGSAGLVDEAANAESGVSILDGTSYGFAFESSGAKQLGSGDTGVTQSHSDMSDQTDRRKAKEMQKEAQGPITDEEGKKLYTGQAGYTQYVKKSKWSGPIRGSANIRADVMMDYAPDVCKDFKETGYCGYGDSCKFLHDRGDYKKGWQLEREETAEEDKKRQARANTFLKKSSGAASGAAPTNDMTEDGLKMSSVGSKDLPFACFICRKPFVNPVVTRCGHYFCQECALKRYATDPSCAVCKESTGGSFNTAVKILKRREELAKLAEKAS